MRLSGSGPAGGWTELLDKSCCTQTADKLSSTPTDKPEREESHLLTSSAQGMAVLRVWSRASAKCDSLIAEDAALAHCPMGADSGGRAVPPAAHGWKKQLDFAVGVLYVVYSIVDTYVKSTCITNNINDGFDLFKCPSKS